MVFDPSVVCNVLGERFPVIESSRNGTRNKTNLSIFTLSLYITDIICDWLVWLHDGLLFNQPGLQRFSLFRPHLHLFLLLPFQLFNLLIQSGRKETSAFQVKITTIAYSCCLEIVSPNFWLLQQKVLKRLTDLTYSWDRMLTWRFTTRWWEMTEIFITVSNYRKPTTKRTSSYKGYHFLATFTNPDVRGYIFFYIITKSMRALWLVNQLWVIVPVNSRKNRASSELLYKSNKPQVSRGYILLINREWGHYREKSDRGLDVLTEQ